MAMAGTFLGLVLLYVIGYGVAWSRFFMKHPYRIHLHDPGRDPLLRSYRPLDRLSQTPAGKPLAAYREWCLSLAARFAGTYTMWVDHVTLNGQETTAEQRQAMYATLHAWLTAEGFTLLTEAKDIQAATRWSLRGTAFSEVYRRPLSPREPDSTCVVAVLEGPKDGAIFFSFTTEVWGNEAGQQRLSPIAKKARLHFCEALKQYPWLKQD